MHKKLSIATLYLIINVTYALNFGQASDHSSFQQTKIDYVTSFTQKLKEEALLTYYQSKSKAKLVSLALLEASAKMTTTKGRWTFKFASVLCNILMPALVKDKRQHSWAANEKEMRCLLTGKSSLHELCSHKVVPWAQDGTYCSTLRENACESSTWYKLVCNPALHTTIVDSYARLKKQQVIKNTVQADTIIENYRPSWSHYRHTTNNKNWLDTLQHKLTHESRSTIHQSNRPHAKPKPRVTDFRRSDIVSGAILQFSFGIPSDKSHKVHDLVSKPNCVLCMLVDSKALQAQVNLSFKNCVVQSQSSWVTVLHSLQSSLCSAVVLWRPELEVLQAQPCANSEFKAHHMQCEKDIKHLSYQLQDVGKHTMQIKRPTQRQIDEHKTSKTKACKAIADSRHLLTSKWLTNNCFTH